MESLDKIVSALAPVFAAGFAVQQLLEIITSFFDLDSRQVFQKYKKPILGLVAFLLGCALANQLNLGVLNILKGAAAGTEVGWADFLATALVISAGTEGVNSILKFLKYSKEDKKREAAGLDPKSSATGSGAVQPPAPVPAPAPAAVAAAAPNGLYAPAATEAALARINQQ